MSSIGNMIPDARRWDVLAGFMNAQGYKTFCEVGCKEGRTTGHVLKNVAESRVIAVDPWRAFPERKGFLNAETYEQWDFAQIEAEFWRNVGDAKDRVTMHRMTSLEAAPKVADESLDLVFIDAGHDYDNVLADIKAWWPKIRSGGMLAGHDYNHKWPAVHRAVADSFNLLDVGVGADSVWFVIKYGRE